MTIMSNFSEKMEEDARQFKTEQRGLTSQHSGNQPKADNKVFTLGELLTAEGQLMPVAFLPVAMFPQGHPPN